MPKRVVHYVAVLFNHLWIEGYILGRSMSMDKFERGLRKVLEADLKEAFPDQEFFMTCHHSGPGPRCDLRVSSHRGTDEVTSVPQLPRETVARVKRITWLALDHYMFGIPPNTKDRIKG